MTTQTANTSQPAQTAKPAVPPEHALDNFDAEWDKLSKDGGETTSPPTSPESAAPAAPTQTAATQDGDEQDDGAPAAPAQTAAPAQQQTTQDLWAGLNDAQRAALAELNTRLDTVTHQARSDAARVSAFQQRLNDLMKQRGTPGASVPTTQQVQEAMQTPEGWAQLKADYPSIAGPIEAALKATEGRILSRVEERVREATEPLLQARQTDEEEKAKQFRAEQVRALADAYPDFADVKRSEDFKRWLANQTPMVQEGIRSHYASDAIQILDLYNASKSGNTVSDLQQRRNKRLQQAVTTGGHSGRAAATSRQAEIPDNFDAAWDELDRRGAAGKQ